MADPASNAAARQAVRIPDTAAAEARHATPQCERHRPPPGPGQVPAPARQLPAAGPVLGTPGRRARSRSLAALPQLGVWSQAPRPSGARACGPTGTSPPPPPSQLHGVGSESRAARGRGGRSRGHRRQGSRGAGGRRRSRGPHRRRTLVGSAAAREDRRDAGSRRTRQPPACICTPPGGGGGRAGAGFGSPAAAPSG